nr:GNAT family N-acetyltransferase [Sphingomicrobium lutaoense]
MILRGFVAEDFVAKQAIMEKPEVHRYLGSPMTRSEHWRRVVSAVGQWIVRGYGGWMVVRQSDDRLIGDLGLFDAQRGIGFDGEPEMGWIFDPEAQGRGYAREACEAVLDWADRELCRDIWAIIEPANRPSFALAEKLGFAVVDRAELNGEPIDILKRVPRP